MVVSTSFFKKKEFHLAQELIYTLLWDIKHMKSNHYVIILFPQELIKLWYGIQIISYGVCISVDLSTK